MVRGYCIGDDAAAWKGHLDRIAQADEDRLGDPFRRDE
jgi:hypothetical protein